MSFTRSVPAAVPVVDRALSAVRAETAVALDALANRGGLTERDADPGV